ncbi:hypothetical protein BDW22DRAFT_1044465 [Trametopsis cervina]|nr:hypothetical protein BDW22DRAFT_1044465 [Trametopsis cervina]
MNNVLPPGSRARHERGEGLRVECVLLLDDCADIVRPVEGSSAWQCEHDTANLRMRRPRLFRHHDYVQVFPSLREPQIRSGGARNKPFSAHAAVLCVRTAVTHPPIQSVTRQVLILVMPTLIPSGPFRSIGRGKSHFPAMVAKQARFPCVAPTACDSRSLISPHPAFAFSPWHRIRQWIRSLLLPSVPFRSSWDSIHLPIPGHTPLRRPLFFRSRSSRESVNPYGERVSLTGDCQSSPAFADIPHTHGKAGARPCCAGGNQFCGSARDEQTPYPHVRHLVLLVPACRRPNIDKTTWNCYSPETVCDSPCHQPDDESGYLASVASNSIITAASAMIRCGAYKLHVAGLWLSYIKKRYYGRVVLLIRCCG